MRRPCVRVERESGERTRQELEAAGLRDYGASIDSDGEFVYIPITEVEGLDDEYEVVDRAVEPREGHTLPTDLLEFTPTYERLGDLVLLQEADDGRAREAATAFMESDLPVKGVLRRTSEVAGEIRVPEWEVLAGESTETIHREYGAEFLVDPTLAYFSPRLATERQRVIDQVEAGECVLDMFTGVGPYAIRAAMAGATVVAVDINPDAVEYCRANAKRNDVEDRVTVIEADIADVADEYAAWADRLIMNLPHRADRFLDEASVLAGDTCRLHFYDIQPEADPFEPGEHAIETAFERTHEVSVATRQRVRSYAPGVLNICLDVDVTRR